MTIFRSTLLRMSYVSGNTCWENQNTYFVCYTILFPKRGAVYEIVWKYMVQPDRAQTTIWRMGIACCITMATDTNSEYVILTAFLQQQWLHECAPLLGLYVHCLFYIPLTCLFYSRRSKIHWRWTRRDINSRLESYPCLLLSLLVLPCHTSFHFDTEHQVELICLNDK